MIGLRQSGKLILTSLLVHHEESELFMECLYLMTSMLVFLTLKHTDLHCSVVFWHMFEKVPARVSPSVSLSHAHTHGSTQGLAWIPCSQEAAVSLRDP